MSRFTVVYLEPVSPAVEQVVRSRLPVEFDLRVRRENEPVESVLADTPAVLQRLKAIWKKEAHMLAHLQTGRLIREWLDQVLRDKGCEIKDFRDLGNKVSEV